MGIVSMDDIVDVIEEEAEEDILRLGGVTETDIHSVALQTSRRRLPWLFINLMTAFLAATVVGAFEHTIEKLVALAVLMPIAASMGGNAGTQALTVAVRAIAVKELTMTNAWRVIGKETLVGILNGLLLAAIAAALIAFWYNDWKLSLVFAVAITCTLMLAGLSGALIPLILSRLGIDPAIASGVFLTTVTDIVAFATFLGVATFFLM